LVSLLLFRIQSLTLNVAQKKLPPKNLCRLKYFKQYAAGKKKLLTKQQAAPVDIKKYPELSTTFALKSCIDDPQCLIYIPDHWLKPKAKTCRHFLWTVLATVRPDFVT
jgi:hypothetical protein